MSQLQSKIASLPTAQSKDYGDSILALDSKVSQLQSKVNNLDTKVNGLDTGSSKNYDKDIAALQKDIATFQEDIDGIQEQLDGIIGDVNTTLADWEKKQKETETNTTYDVTWTRDVGSNKDPSEVTIGYWQTPSQMDSDGTYIMKFTIKNNLATDMTDLVVIITLIPNGEVLVDAKNIYVDTITKPYTLWNVGIATTGANKFCRRITLTSEDITIKAGETLQPKCEFVLTYK